MDGGARPLFFYKLSSPQYKILSLLHNCGRILFCVLFSMHEWSFVSLVVQDAFFAPFYRFDLDLHLLTFLLTSFFTALLLLYVVKRRDYIIGCIVHVVVLFGYGLMLF